MQRWCKLQHLAYRLSLTPPRSINHHSDQIGAFFSRTAARLGPSLVQEPTTPLTTPEPSRRPVGPSIRAIDHGAFVTKPSSSWSACNPRQTIHARPWRPFSHCSESHIIVAFTHHSTSSIIVELKGKLQDTQDPHPRLLGLWDSSGAVSLGQGAIAVAWKDYSYQRRHRAILAAGDSRKQPQAGTRQ